MIYCGIDPGVGGSVAILKDDGLKDIYPTPVITEKKKKGHRRVYNEKAMADLFKQLNPATDGILVVLERAQAMPGQGVVSMFSIGVGFGLWKGILAALAIPYQIVSARTWQKEFFSPGDDTKAKSVGVAQKLFPQYSFVTPRGRKLDGQADAALMAEYARRIYKRNEGVT